MNKPLLFAGCLAAAFLPSLSGMVARPDEWYQSLAKPALNPPPQVFPIVWTTLYAMMGVAHYKYTTAETGHDKSAGHRWYALQLLLNGTWSLVFFRAQAPRAAFVNIILLLVSIVATIAQFRRVSKTSGRLLLPYLMWVCFATYLNFEICRLNNEQE